MDYHLMTMNEPRDSPAKRQQFLVICAVMASTFLYTAITSGAFVTIQGTVAPFPGGNFCYKAGIRDYAVSIGMGRSLAEDWQQSTMGMPTSSDETFAQTIFQSERDEVHGRKQLVDKKMYHIYLDDPNIVSSLRSRWMTGLLVSDNEMDDYCSPLLANNPKIEKIVKRNTKEKVVIDDLNPSGYFAQARYELMDLPSVDSLVVQFPFTNGFVSALLFSYKVLPQIRKLAATKMQEGNEIVVISYCSTKQEMCTHYVPLSNGKEFFGGRPTMEEHRLQYVNESRFFRYDKFMNDMNAMMKYIKKTLGISVVNDNEL